MQKIMNKSNTDKPEMHGEKLDISKQRAISSAVLGVPSSYGVKLSLNVTSQKKKELLSKLEEWRKAREEKLVSSILAKQKQVNNSKNTFASALKSKPNGTGYLNLDDTTQQNQKRETVFDRLYKNSSKIKKQGIHADPSVKVLSNCDPVSKNYSTLSSYNSEINQKQVMDSVTSTAATGAMTLNQVNTIYKNKSNKQDDAELFFSAGANYEQALGKNETKNCEKILLTQDALALESTSGEFPDESRESHLEKVPNIDTFKSVAHFDEVSDPEKCESGGIDTSKVDSHEYSQRPAEEKDKLTILKSIKGTSPLTNANYSERNKFVLDSSKRDVPSVTVSGNVQNVKKFKKTIRRSISMVYRSKCRSNPTIRRAKSENFDGIKSRSAQVDSTKKPPPSSALLKSKKQSKRKTLAGSAQSDNSKIVASDTPLCLREKLEDWLKVNGHPLEKYRHLRCFGISNPTKPPPGSFRKTVRVTSNTCDLLRIPSRQVQVDDSDKENVVPPSANASQTVEDVDVENWLKELHRLIVEAKYPSERCEEWLAAIRKNSAACTKLRIYWECMAALDEAEGDSKPFEKGFSEEKNVDSLADLFDKMVIEQDGASKPKLEKGLDPKNIFKSTVIKFSVQQKGPKEFKKKAEPNISKQQYIATPVRRSSRIRTPSKPHVVSSLQSLNDDVRNNTTFKPNESLFHGE